MNNFEFRLSALAAVSVLASLASAAPTKYRVVPVIRGDRGSVTANAINNLGQIAGTRDTFADVNPAYVAPGKDLPFLGQGQGAEANDVNDLGQATGYSSILGYDDPTHAFLYSNGTVKDLGTLGGQNSFGFGINESGQVVGRSNIPNGSLHAFLYENGVMKDLGTLGGSQSYADDINEMGQVVGTSTTNGLLSSRAFLYENGVMQNLGTLGGANSSASAINNKGDIIGTSDLLNGSQRAFLYTNGAMADLGTFGGANSYALSINSKGQIIGTADTPTRPQLPFLYTEGAMYSLDSLLDFSGADWQVIQYTDINDSGQISGLAFSKLDGRLYAVRFNPVPEPSSLVALSLPALFLLRRRKGR